MYFVFVFFFFYLKKAMSGEIGSCLSSSVKFGRPKQLRIFWFQGIRSFVEFISL